MPTRRTNSPLSGAEQLSAFRHKIDKRAAGDPPYASLSAKEARLLQRLLDHPAVAAVARSLP